MNMAGSSDVVSIDVVILNFCRILLQSFLRSLESSF